MLSRSCRHIERCLAHKRIFTRGDLFHFHSFFSRHLSVALFLTQSFFLVTIILVALRASHSLSLHLLRRNPVPHLKVVLNDLEQLWRLRDSTALDLAPDGHVVQADLEGARGDELALDGVADEEDHEAGVELMVNQRLIEGWSLDEPEEWEWVERRQDCHEQNHLEDAQDLREHHFPVRGRVVVALDGELWVLLLQRVSILLKYLAVTSGIAIEEFD